MTDPNSQTDIDDPGALEFCRSYLQRSPHATYKEVRRQAWEEGLKVTRRTFTKICREFSEGVSETDSDEVSAEPRADQEKLPGEQSDIPAAGKAEEAPAKEVADAPKRGIQQWDDLFGGSEDEQPGESAGEGGEEPAAESPTETARRALGLLAPPAATDEPRQNAVEFMASYLREKPEASYKEVRDAAESNGYTVSSATFGRAQAITGILDDDEEEQEEDVGVAVAAPAPAQRARRRGRDPAELLEEFIQHWELASLERAQFRDALKGMLKVVERALQEK